MSDKNLFSNPVLTSSEDLDKDYDLDSNGVEFDPNIESVFNDINSQSEQTNNLNLDQEENDKFDELFQTEPLDKPKDEKKFDDIFKTETVEIPDLEEAPLDESTAASADSNIDTDSTAVYEDEPKKNNRRIIIFSLIGIVALLCLSWFVYAMYNNSSEPVIENVQTEESITPTPVVPTPPSQNNTNDNYNYNNSDNYYNDYNDYNYDYQDPYYEDDYYYDDTPEYVIPEEPENEEDLKDYHEPDYENWYYYEEETIEQENNYGDMEPEQPLDIF